MIAPPEKVVVAAVGFVDEREVQSSERAIVLAIVLKVHDVWNSHNAKVFQTRTIYENPPAGSVSALLPFDALTGCDTSSICNHSNSLESIPKAPHISFLTMIGRANREK